MHLKILSWNVRGLNAFDKRMAVKAFIKGVRPNVICLQETKVEEVERGFVRDIWGGSFVEWKDLPARGASGGVLVCWDSRVVVCEDFEIGGYLFIYGFEFSYYASLV